MTDTADIKGMSNSDLDKAIDNAGNDELKP